MFKKIGKFFCNIKLRYKLFLVYVVIGVVPVMLTMAASINLMTSIIKEKERKSTQTYLTQATYNVNSELIAYNSLSDYITFNNSIAQVLVADYRNQYDLYDKIVSVIKPQIDTVTYFSDSVNQVSIYTDIPNKKYDNIILPLDEIRDEFWYKEVYDDVACHWYVDREKNIAFCVRQMAMMNQGKFGIFYVSIEYDKLFAALSNEMGNNYGVYITDKNNEVVYSLAKFEDKYSKYELSYEQLDEYSDREEYTVLYNDLTQAQWRIWLYKPEISMVSDTEPIKNVIYVSIIIAFMAMLVGTFWVSHFVTRRIAYLRDGMKSAEKGDFTVRVETEDKDEIGELIRGYNSLLGKIQTLIKEVYESEITQKKYEMKALQNQINPHFLYNSLSLINWKAIENGNMDISSITLALSNFYRTSLNKGRNILTVEEEISNVKSYIMIQLVMHDNEFDVEYNIEDSILKYETLNLILQPIVENAIEHGIDVKEDGERGKITITGWLEENKVYISVADNGVGMDEEKAKTIITQNSKGYGIRNVNERIELYYGEEYCLSVDSKIGEGTCITVCIPAIETISE